MFNRNQYFSFRLIEPKYVIFRHSEQEICWHIPTASSWILSIYTPIGVSADYLFKFRYIKPGYWLDLHHDEILELNFTQIS